MRAAVTSARCEKAWGKFPSWRFAPGPYSSERRPRSFRTRQGRRSYCDGDGAFGKKFRVSAAMKCKHAAMLRGQKIVDRPEQSSLPFASEPPRRPPNYLLVYQRNL